MQLYQNLRKESPIRAIEFPDSLGDNCAFLHVRSHEQLGMVEQWLAKTGQTILAQTLVDGQPLLVVSDGKGRGGILQALEAGGEKFKQPPPKKKGLGDPWVWRGITSFAGQSLTLIGSLRSMKAKKSLGLGSSSNADGIAMAGFATTNLVANLSNIIFGQQKKDDPHQLRYLKERVNAQLSERLPAGMVLPGADENRSSLRWEAPLSAGQKAFNVGRKYSVSGGEIGLRLLGATSLAFPVNQWNNIGSALGNGSFDDIKNPNPVTYKAGLITLLGKFVSLASSEPDPYNPKPPSLIRTIREKVTFRLSSVIEGAGAVMMARDQFKDNKLASIGSMIFIGGYFIRLFAPYGEREVNMKELTAHITDSVATMPGEQLPQCLADIAFDLNRHFKGKGQSVAEIYSNLATDLKKHHGIDLFSADASASQAVMQELEAPTQAHQTQPDRAPFAQENMRKSQRPTDFSPRPASHQETATMREAAFVGVTR